MKPPYTHVSRTALAVVAAAGSVWLSAFFLPGAGVQPIPLLPELGTAAGKVVAASLPHAKPKRTETTRPSNAAPAVAREPAAVTFAPQAARSRPKVRAVPTHRAHRQQPAAGPKRSAPVQAAAPAPAVATTASATAASVSSAAAPRGRAVGWHRKHDHADAAAPTAPTGRHGHSHAKHGYGSPAQPAPAPTVTPAPAAPAAPPSVGGHDNGKHLGNGNGNQEHGPGGRP